MKPLWLLLGLIFAPAVFAAEHLPPKPSHYFNDYANVVGATTAADLNAELEQFERETSNQIIVAIYPAMESDDSVQNYTQRLVDAWKFGQSQTSNGAVLFAFMAGHQLWIQTGYGLEARLTDATCKRIISDEMAPRLRAQDPDGAFRAAVDAMIAATKGEYSGNGRTDYERHRRGSNNNLGIFVFVLFLIIWSIARSRRHVVYGGRGRGGFWGGGGPWIFPGGGWGGGGGGSGGWGGGGGGNVSAGGGSFGGGGAGGSW